MGVDIRLPMITAQTEAGQLEQVKSYLYQLAEQLNWALETVEKQAEGAVERAVVAAGTAEVKAPESTFNSIKSLIIKSADIVNAYYEEINKKLVGEYVAVSDFGKYEEKTSQEIEATSNKITQIFSNMQTITNDIGKITESMVTNAYIRSGELYYDENGTPIVGLEVGQTVEKDGEAIFDQFARFTASGMTFYDENGNEAAYITDKKLLIRYAEIMVSFVIGGFEDTVLSDYSVITKWIGGGR